MEELKLVFEHSKNLNVPFFKAIDDLQLRTLLIGKIDFTLTLSGDKNYSRDKISVLHTGVRAGEVVRGCGLQSKDTILSTSGAMIPPDRRALAYLHQDSEMWSRFIRRLSSIEFFQELSFVERELWLWAHQDSGEEDNYLEDIPNLEVEVLQIGGGKECAFVALGEEVVNHLSSVGSVSPATITAFFKGKPGSSGLQGRHTLIFRRGNWEVTSIYRDVNSNSPSSSDIPLIDISHSNSTRTLEFESFAKEYEGSTSKKIARTARGRVMKPPGKVVNQLQTVHIRFDRETIEKNEDLLISQFVLPGTQFDITDVKLIRGACRTFTAASYKSALQKFIRFRSIRISCPEFSLPTEFVVKVVFVMLLCHPGGFVPDIQRFVGGTESAFKRLVVTAFEDSFFDSNLDGEVMNLITAAYLAQRVPGWRPSPSLLVSALHLIDVLLASDRGFLYSVVDGGLLPKYTISSESSPLEVVSSMMEELKSFQGDLNMIRHITFYKHERRCATNPVRPEEVVWWHLIDQHFAPEIAYFFSPEIVEAHVVKGTCPYSNLFVKLFSEVTGVNPRRALSKECTTRKHAYSKDFENRDFVMIVREAQRSYLLYRTSSESSDAKKTPKTTFKYELERGMIAGLMGSILVKGREPALVSLHPDNPETFLAVANPSRTMKSPILSPARENAVIGEVFEKMKRFGVPLSACRSPIDEMRRALLYVTKESTLEHPEYLIRLHTERFERWDDFRKGEKRVRIVDGADVILSELVRSNVKRAQRLLSYISNRNSTVEFKHIGRDGGGTQGAVSIYDVGAFALMRQIEELYSSAIRRVEGNVLKFQTVFSPLMWHISHLISNSIQSSTPSSSSSSSGNWGEFGLCDTRVMREYQTESVEAMVKAHTLGRRGSFINIETGRGKTKIVLEYMKWLLHNNSLPSTVVYTLPGSAMESVIAEIKMFGANYTVINPLKTKVTQSPNHPIIRDSIPLKYHINLIEHDHLRLCTDTLADHMSDAIFVFDEVHKALRESLRTDRGLQLSSLSVEFIAMTGTPIIDSNTYRLMWWLSQISPFEVTDKNFFVSAAGMISKRTVLPSRIVRDEVYVPMTPEEEKAYAKLVPPALGGTNANPRNEDFSRAFEICYSIITRCMIESTTSGFIVAKDRAHQSFIVDELVKRGIERNEIFVISNGNSIFFTDETVESGVTPDYKFVVTTQSYSSGYTLTRLNRMVTGVYPSNQATREQLDGRINRIGQKAPVLEYKIYHTGLLTHTLQRYNDAKNLSDVIKRFATEIHI